MLELEELIRDRRLHPIESSYTSALFAGGINRIAQKVGEEAVELVFESKDSDDKRFTDEAADLLYHFLVLLAAKDVRLDDIAKELRGRRR